MLKGETVITETFAGGRTFLTIAVLVNPSGMEVKGVLLGNFALESLEEELVNATTDISSVYLLDGQGRLLLAGKK